MSRFCASGVLLMTVLSAVGAKADPCRAISSGRNDVVYLAPATEPYEALPLGNGQLGVMVRNAPAMNYIFNHGSFFANGEQDNELISSGELSLALPEAWQRGFVDQRLALHDALIVTRFQTGAAQHTIKSWLAEGLDLMVIEIESTANLPDLTAILSIWERKISSEATASRDDVCLTTVGVGGHRATALVVQALEGQTQTSAKGLQGSLEISTTTKHLTLLVACPVVTGQGLGSESARRAARQALATAQAKGGAALWQEHLNYWHDFWTRSGVLMHSEDGLADYVENLYHLHLYWMAACSRGPEAPKFNGGNFLFGNDGRSWGGYYWYQNTRELFWPLLPANHPELLKPLLDLYWRNLPAAQKLAKDLFNAPGACYHETMGRTGHGDKANNTYTCLYHTTGTEIAHQFYQYYLHTRDEAFLAERAYPLMQEALTFHLSFLHKESNGLYYVYPSNARETYWWIKDSITDLTALRTMLPILLLESQRLGRESDQWTHWIEVLGHLKRPLVDESRKVFLPGSFLDDFPPTPFKRPEQLYPPDKSRTSRSKGNAFNYENVDCEPLWPWGLVGLNSEDREYSLARQTFLQRRHNEWTWGNAWDWSSLMACRLGLSSEVVKCFGQYVRNVQEFPSGMAGTPGNAPKVWGGQLGDSPGLDASGVLAAAVAEMQLQSYGGAIRVFPAQPKGWQSEFTLAAEGGFLVSSRINTNGGIPEVRIVSRGGNPCTVINPWTGGAVLRSPGGTQNLAQTNRFVFPTRPGDEFVLTPADGAARFVPIPVARNEAPKWPFHQSPQDTLEAYLQRTSAFGMLGIARDGQNPTRNKVRKALAEQAKAKGKNP